MQTVDGKVISRVYGKKRGWVLSPIHFQDIGSRPAIDKILSRMVDKGVFVPSMDAVANALKDLGAARISDLSGNGVCEFEMVNCPVF